MFLCGTMQLEMFDVCLKNWQATALVCRVVQLQNQ